MRIAGIAVLLILACAPGSTVQARQDGAFEDKALVAGMGLAEYRAYLATHQPLDRLFCRGDWCVFLVSPRQLEDLHASAVHFRLSTVTAARTTGGTLQGGGRNGFYHDYQETTDRLRDLESRFPDLARVVAIGHSLEGREIYTLKISDNVQSEENEPNLYITGCHHAREWISVEVPLAFAEYLLEHFADDAEVQRAVSGAQIYVTPMLNPDGLEFSIHTYRFWRKNRRYNGEMSWGVDLNRNYGYQWGHDDNGSGADADAEDYRGQSAFSEPETRALRDFMSAHPPSGALSYHNFSQTILFPWGYTNDPAPAASEMSSIAQEMSRRMYGASGRYYSYGASPTLYNTNGDHDDWVYGTFGAPSFTVELPPDSLLQGGFYTSEAEIARCVSENNPAILYLVNYFVAKHAAPRPAAR